MCFLIYFDIIGHTFFFVVVVVLLYRVVYPLPQHSKPGEDEETMYSKCFLYNTGAKSPAIDVKVFLKTVNSFKSTILASHILMYSFRLQVRFQTFTSGIYIFSHNVLLQHFNVLL